MPDRVLARRSEISRPELTCRYLLIRAQSSVLAVKYQLCTLVQGPCTTIDQTVVLRSHRSMLLHAHASTECTLHTSAPRPSALPSRRQQRCRRAAWRCLRAAASVSAAPLTSRAADQLVNWLESVCGRNHSTHRPLPSLNSRWQTRPMTDCPVTSRSEHSRRQNCRRQVVEPQQAGRHAGAGFQSGPGAGPRHKSGCGAGRGAGLGPRKPVDHGRRRRQERARRAAVAAAGTLAPGVASSD